jgi:WD40 repeat protein
MANSEGNRTANWMLELMPVTPQISALCSEDKRGRISDQYQPRPRTMRADGSYMTRITQGGNATAGPSWSPDGRWLAFADANHTLVKVRTTAPFGTPTPILGCFEICEDGPQPELVDRTLAWSPDGTRIVFAGATPYSCDKALWMLNVATSELIFDREDVGSGCSTFNSLWSDLVWGPAGQWGFGFQRQIVDGPMDSSTPVYANIDYPGFYSPIIKTEYDGYAYDEDLAAVRGDKSPTPSPSGRYMAFVNDTSGIAKIYIAKADGSSRRQLTYGYQPDWQRLS